MVSGLLGLTLRVGGARGAWEDLSSWWIQSFSLLRCPAH